MGKQRATEIALTNELVRRALDIRHEDLPLAVRQVSRDSLADWLACTLAGREEPGSRIVAQALLEEGGAAQAILIGDGARVSVAQAALANGTASHALDYDDVNLALPGHPGVAIFPAVVALADYLDVSGPALYAAFVAGYETACRIGVLLAPGHYARGFHATATIGSLGAAVACAHLLKLSAEQTCHALGVAATQAAGLKSMFGGMAKPLHAGMAAQTGARAALLARKGFVSRLDAIECLQGFADTHGDDFRVDEALADPPGGYHLLGNLFKFHAACFSTHSTIEAVRDLRHMHALQAADITAIDVVAGDACSICNIQEPATALEAKFSLRAAASFALLDIDTARLDTWGRVAESDIKAMMRRVRVTLVPGMSLSAAAVTLHTQSGASFRKDVDAGVPLSDKTQQSRRVEEKFLAVTAPFLNPNQGRRILASLDTLQGAGRPRDFLALLHQEIDRGDISK
ncbi:hypothetical protein ASB57_11745 [Bordetella sp. N]|nr:hypothetical protein ASB57_11745 [Bordetella sp. N]